MCQRAIQALVPGGPLGFEAATDLERAAKNNIEWLYHNGGRYWNGYSDSLGKYPLSVLFTSFMLGEVASSTLFFGMSNKATHPVFKEIFKRVGQDEARHLAICLTILENDWPGLSDEHKTLITKQLRAGFVFLSMILWEPPKQFWEIPDYFRGQSSGAGATRARAGLGCAPAMSKRKIGAPHWPACGPSWANGASHFRRSPNSIWMASTWATSGRKILSRCSRPAPRRFRGEPTGNARRMRFPEVQGENLAGQKLAFPRDFGARSIVLVAFDLRARDDLESWVPFVDRFARAGTLNGRVFPVLSRSMRMMQGVILTTLRKTAPPAPEVRAATVPLFVDIDAFCAALDITDRSAIQVFLVEPNGTVLEHRTGPYSDAAAAQIETHVKSGV